MCSCQKRISGMKALKGVNLERLAAVGGGAIGAKALNGMTKNIEFLHKNKYTMPLAKVLVGGYAQTAKNTVVRDLGLGAIAVGLLELAEVVAPQVFDMNGIGSTRRLRTIDLDGGVSGYNWDTVNNMEDDHGVAGVDPVDYAVI